MSKVKRDCKFGFGVALLSGFFVIAGACAHRTQSDLLGSESNVKQGSSVGYGADSIDPAYVKRFAPPELNPELSRRISTLLDVRSQGMGLLHPDQKRFFFTWRVTGTSQVWMLNSPNSFPIQMTGGSDQVYLVDITPDGKDLILSVDRNGEEAPGIYLQSVDGGELRIIQHLPKVRTSYQFVTDNSEWIYFTANDVEPTSFAIYRWSLKTKQKELVFEKKGIWSVLDQRPDGRLLLNRQITNMANEVYEWRPSERQLKPLFGQGEETEYMTVYGPQDGEYFYSSPKSEFRHLYHVRNGQVKNLTPDLKGDVVSVSIDLKRKHLVYVTNVNSYMSFRVKNAKTLADVGIELPKGLVHTYAGSLSRDGRFMSVGLESGKSPRVTATYDFERRQLTRWTYPSAPMVDLNQFVESKLEYYPARDGIKIPMFVRRPAACAQKACPVVVHFHGGPEGQSMPGFSVFAQMFVEKGFVFVEPNVRGSEGYGRTWARSDDGPKRLSVITDISDCAEYIRKNWKDAKTGEEPKIGVMGWSYGGYSTFYAMTRFAGSYDAGVALVGMSDLRTFLNNTAPYRRALRIPEYGDPIKDAKALEELSPVTYLAKLKDPLLIVQGVNDPRVPVLEAKQIYDEMQRKGLAGGLVLFADEGHGTQKKSNQILELGLTLEFFIKNLK